MTGRRLRATLPVAAMLMASSVPTRAQSDADRHLSGRARIVLGAPAATSLSEAGSDSRSPSPTTPAAPSAPAPPPAAPPRPAPPGEPGPPDVATDASKPSSGPMLTLEEAIAIALARNRTLIAARLNGAVADAGVEIAAERPNPDLAFQANRDTPKESLVLSWPIETASKRSRRIDVSRAGVSRVASEMRQAEAEIRNQVRRAYYALAAAQDRLAQMEEAGTIAKRAEAASRERFEAGQVPRLEMLKGALSTAQAENDIDLARASLVAARSDLGVLLAGDPSEPMTVSHDLAEGTVPDLEAARGLAEQANLDLQVLDGRIAESKARAALARANQHPDPVLQGGVTYDNEPEWLWGWQAGVSITLPVATRHRAEVVEEERTLAGLLGQREALAATVDAAVLSAASIASAKRAAYLRYRDEILPRAREVEGMAEESYREGRTGQVELLQAIQFLNDLRVRTVQAGFDYQIALADLERAIGAQLP
jgi:cobalt-zinc-cadmium efflux system outer membrane protein